MYEVHMTLLFKCPQGHTYMLGDVVDGPGGCPVCRGEVSDLERVRWPIDRFVQQAYPQRIIAIEEMVKALFQHEDPREWMLVSQTDTSDPQKIVQRFWFEWRTHGTGKV